MRRGGQILFAVVMAAAVVGFFVGIDDGAPRPDEERGPVARVASHPADDPGPASAPAPASGSAPAMPATSYTELRERRIGANAGFLNRVDDLAEPAEPPEEPPPAPVKRASLEDRGERRAYNGAPPTIPHAVDAISSDACLGCHEVGATLEKQRADRMPHPYLTACQQCHAPTESPIDPTLLVASRFVGVPAPFEGERAWKGAPPTIPHTTLMRDTCASCHGPQGKPGLRTSHPERVSCTQCHAPSAELDQVAVGPPGFLDAPRTASADSAR